VPSTRPIDATACGLWPTPTTRDHKDSIGMSFAPRKDGASRLDLLPRQVYWIAQNTPAALWGTPLAQQANGEPEQFLQRRRDSIARGNSMGVSLSDLNMQVKAATALACWPTPTALSPNAARGTGQCPHKWKAGGHQVNLMDAVTVHRGTELDGSPDGTEKPGALNPAFVCWLMGFPVEWLFAAPSDKAQPRTKKSTGTTESEPSGPSAMPSSRKSRRK